MKREFACIMLIAMLLTLTACGEAVESGTTQYIPIDPISTPKIETIPDAASVAVNDSTAEPEPSGNESQKDAMADIIITVGSSVFSAKLYDNDAAKALLAQFPMTVNMSDLNGNEKYYYLADHLTSESTEKPSTINAGDMMGWSGVCWELFIVGLGRG